MAKVFWFNNSRIPIIDPITWPVSSRFHVINDPKILAQLKDLRDKAMALECEMARPIIDNEIKVND